MHLCSILHDTSWMKRNKYTLLNTIEKIHADYVSFLCVVCLLYRLMFLHDFSFQHRQKLFPFCCATVCATLTKYSQTLYNSSMILSACTGFTLSVYILKIKATTPSHTTHIQLVANILFSGVQ